VREKEDFCPACQTHSTTELKVQNGPISLVIVALNWNHPAAALHSRITFAIDLLCGASVGLDVWTVLGSAHFSIFSRKIWARITKQRSILVGKNSLLAASKYLIQEGMKWHRGCDQTLPPSILWCLSSMQCTDLVCPRRRTNSKPFLQQTNLSMYQYCDTKSIFPPSAREKDSITR
jgi:hypothetical protein